MIDSNDRERLSEAFDELAKMGREDELRNATFLVLANKQDLPNAMSAKEIEIKLNEYAAAQQLLKTNTVYVIHIDFFFSLLNFGSNITCLEKSFQQWLQKERVYTQLLVGWSHISPIPTHLGTSLILQLQVRDTHKFDTNIHTTYIQKTQVHKNTHSLSYTCTPCAFTLLTPDPPLIQGV